jgi:hypothetical protein
MKPKRIYENVFSGDEIDSAFNAVLNTTRTTLNLSPMLETLVFLIAFMQASDDANIDYRKVMKAIANGQELKDVFVQRTVQ